jgi:hypothetical protein
MMQILQREHGSLPWNKTLHTNSIPFTATLKAEYVRKSEIMDAQAKR